MNLYKEHVSPCMHFIFVEPRASMLDIRVSNTELPTRITKIPRVACRLIGVEAHFCVYNIQSEIGDI